MRDCVLGMVFVKCKVVVRVIVEVVRTKHVTWVVLVARRLVKATVVATTVVVLVIVLKSVAKNVNVRVVVLTWIVVLG